jgi:hypothetical protein
MDANHRPQRVRSEAEMSMAVASKLGKYATRELKIGDCIFDVVAYNKTERLFRVVECKKSSKASKIGHAFGQLAAYHATIATRGEEFVIAYSRKVPARMHLGRWMEATHNYRRIRIAFYVALTEKACKRSELIRSLKKFLPVVGVIRVKENGFCRDYIWSGKQRDREIAKARPVTVRILRKVAP